MTYEEFQKQVESISNIKLVEMAKEAISLMCKTGGNSFRMTIPPRTDDTDVVLSEIIRRFETGH